ncbi:carbohydrate binding domain protein [Collimonas fungivorans]|uniref:Carbohydrate binding domain protein n=1 Tax=Collimonas fungivorans TaxID=158899 RepID=A0A127PB35_9BURK|nr:chitin-binding protein [Collimonas fungivorans]AMO94834.1 carbohydrate binding domain protein [Collimonas fungivorans]
MRTIVSKTLLLGLAGAMLTACSDGGSSGAASASLQQVSAKASAPACAAAWVASAIYTGGNSASYSNVNYTANWWTQGNNPSTESGPIGSGKPWTSAGACGDAAPPVTPPPVTPPPPGATTGTINFHLLLGAGSAQDQLLLDGGNYNDLIMSNIIAGVMYGHLLQQYYPGMQFQKDYLYGSILGQLLQENIATGLYVSSGSLIDPSPDQQAVMATGQGGPYQINNYAADMVSGSYAPAGHSLINYVAIQKNIGYTMANAAQQYSKPTPPSFNNKYYGPMLTAYFHYNDFVALIVTGKGTGGWTTPWQPDYDKALVNFTKLPNNFLDVLLNVAYNQGFYGTLMSSYSKLAATATASTVASVNAYSSVWGATDTYKQYPYQVRYYLDQLYDNPIPTTSATTFVTPANHVAFSVPALATVFSNVFQTLAYVNGSGQSAYISAAQAQAAFNGALATAGVAAGATLDLSNGANRAQIFSVLEKAIGNLETNLNTKFNATTSAQL